MRACCFAVNGKPASLPDCAKPAPLDIIAPYVQTCICLGATGGMPSPKPSVAGRSAMLMEKRHHQLVPTSVPGQSESTSYDFVMSGTLQQGKFLAYVTLRMSQSCCQRMLLVYDHLCPAQHTVGHGHIQVGAPMCGSHKSVVVLRACSCMKRQLALAAGCWCTLVSCLLDHCRYNVLQATYIVAFCMCSQLLGVAVCQPNLGLVR